MLSINALIRFEVSKTFSLRKSPFLVYSFSRITQRASFKILIQRAVICVQFLALYRLRIAFVFVRVDSKIRDVADKRKLGWKDVDL